VYYGAPDVFGHRFWRYERPEDFQPPPGAGEVEAAGDFVRAAYERTDAMIGEIVAASPGANILVLSDHGMQSDTRRSRFDAGQPLRFILSGQHREGPPAMFVAAGPSIRSGGAAPESAKRSDLRELGSMADVAPTVLALLGLPVGRDLIGEPLADVLTPEHLAAHPVTEVPALTPDGWWESRGGGRETATPDTEERLEQLRSLGYLD
jgi:arylsulfatase A-like enzyme